MINKKNNIDTVIWIVSSMILACFYFAFYGDHSDIVLKSLLSLSASVLIASILLYKNKVHLGLGLLFISELMGSFAGLVADKNSIFITSELCLSLVGVFSGLMLIINQIQRDKQSINIKNIVNTELKAFRPHILMRAIMFMCMVSVVFILTPVYMQSVPGVTWISTLYVTLPLFIVMMSLVTSYDALLLRAIYYFMWLMILQQGVDIGMVSTVTMVEPLVFMIITLYTMFYRPKVNIEDKVNK